MAAGKEKPQHLILLFCTAIGKIPEGFTSGILP